MNHVFEQFVSSIKLYRSIDDSTNQLFIELFFLFSQFYDAFGNYDVFLYPWPSAVFIAATNRRLTSFQSR